MLPGDFILVERNGKSARFIRAGQRRRYHGEMAKFAKITHAALVTSPEGDLVESLYSTGVARTHIDKYRDLPYELVHVNASEQDQVQILNFVQCVIGQKYGWATIACCLLGDLTSGGLTFGFQGQAICSGLVARAEERTGAYFSRLAEDVCPADLGFYYRLYPVSPGPSAGLTWRLTSPTPALLVAP